MSIFIKAASGLYHSVIYTDDSGKHFRFSGGTWAWRNHNPGNIRPGKVSNRNNQIGVAYNFAVFPDYESGHNALLDVLETTYYNSSIDEMMAHFAPPKENNTAKYRKFLHDATGVKDDKKIKDFTPNEYEQLWKGIEQIESSKEGNITEVYQITQTRINKNGVIFYYCIGNEWISIEECITFAKQGLVDVEICISPLQNTYLRSAPSSFFQDNLRSLIDKEHKE